MEKNPLVTIAIPIYNAEKYLRYSILSVLNQTYTNWELILIDDGSTDASKKIAEEFAEKDIRISVLADGINRGLVSRLNQSIDLAKGVFYTRMDADDIMAVDRISMQVGMLSSNKGVDVVGSSAMLINEHNDIIGSQNMAGITTSFMHPTVMGFTSWFKKYKYDSSFHRIEDMDLWLRSMPFSKFYNIPRPLLFYRAFGTQSSSQFHESNKRRRKVFLNYKRYGQNKIWCLKRLMILYVKDIIILLSKALCLTNFLTYARKRNPVPNSLCLCRIDLSNSICEYAEQHI